MTKFYAHATRKVADLIPYARNARTHSDDQISQIASSIKEFGFTNPILIDENNSIVAGHGRLLALNLLGQAEAPCIILDGLTENQKRAYIIADNKLSLNAGWNDEMLALELQALDEVDFNLSLTGFDDSEIAELYAELAITQLDPQSDPDSVPELLPDPITKAGDVWLLGKHRLMCGDSTSIDAVDKLMGGQRADICFTSPPYNAGKSEKLSGNTHTVDNKYGEYMDDKTFDEYINLLCEFTDTWMQVSDCLVVNIQQLAGNKTVFIDWLYRYKDHFIDMAIWDKGHAQPAMAENVMSSRFEYLVFLSSNTSPSRVIPGRKWRGTVQNLYEGKPQRSNEFSDIHAATFPVHLPEWIINTFTNHYSLIGDAFGGTGTTMIAAEKNGRVSRLMEIDPKYCDVIVRRWQQFAGKEATLESTGQTFASLTTGA